MVLTVSLTSVPEPGRKVLTVMVLPGAGNWASIIALMKGCTKAGDRALRLSTSSNTYSAHIYTNTYVMNYFYANNIIIGDQGG